MQERQYIERYIGFGPQSGDQISSGWGDAGPEITRPVINLTDVLGIEKGWKAFIANPCPEAAEGFLENLIGFLEKNDWFAPKINPDSLRFLLECIPDGRLFEKLERAENGVYMFGNVPMLSRLQQAARLLPECCDIISKRNVSTINDGEVITHVNEAPATIRRTDAMTAGRPVRLGEVATLRI